MKNIVVILIILLLVFTLFQKGGSSLNIADLPLDKIKELCASDSNMYEVCKNNMILVQIRPCS